MYYRFILVNSNDMSRIGELSLASSRKFDIVLGKPGSASFTYPMDADYSSVIQPYKTGIKIERHNRKASIAVGHSVWDCVWSGYVLPVDEQVSANHMNISCVGWTQRLGKRMLRRAKTYLAQDDGAIVGDLINEMNLTTAPDGYAVPVVAGSNPNTPTWLTWGGTQPNEGAGGATAYIPLSDPRMGPALRNKSMPIYAGALTQIDELQNIENGGDLVCDPITRNVTWHRKYRRIKDDVVFGFEWGPQNVSDFSRNIDADAQVNYLVTTGASGTTPQYAHNQPQQAQIGLLEEQIAIPDMKDNSMMLAYAGAEIIVRAYGRITYGVTPFPYSPEVEGGVPEPFVDWRVGDQVRLTAVHQPRVNIRGQAIRIFGINLSVNENGIAVFGALQVAP
jgi:hypothetical protein